MPKDNGSPDWMARKLSDGSFRLGRTSENYDPYLFGNSLSTQEYSNFRTQLFECPSEKKSELIRKFMKIPPYFGKGGHIVTLDETGMLRHIGPSTIKKKDSSELVTLLAGE